MKRSRSLSSISKCWKPMFTLHREETICPHLTSSILALANRKIKLAASPTRWPGKTPTKIQRMSVHPNSTRLYFLVMLTMERPGSTEVIAETPPVSVLTRIVMPGRMVRNERTGSRLKAQGSQSGLKRHWIRIPGFRRREPIYLLFISSVKGCHTWQGGTACVTSSQMKSRHLWMLLLP